MITRFAAAGALTFAAFLTQSLPVAACGGLIAPNGAIRLSRASTLVDWHDGVEHYMTSFSYQGSASNFGWIVPLPAVPEKVEEGGGWTLQRLFRETHPIKFIGLAFSSARLGAQADGVEVLQQVKVRALDITVLRGSGQAVIDWAKEHDFFLDAETSGHLLVYAHASPIFMAAKYDAAAAEATRQRQGDGAPVLITMKTAHPWVPLEVLAAGTAQVKADLYLLSDLPINTTEIGAVLGESAVGTSVPGAPGFKVEYQQKLNDALFRDLSTDKNMGWVRPNTWLTYLTLDAPARSVTYDLGVSLMGVIKLAHAGTYPMALIDGSAHRAPAPNWPTLPLGTGRLLLLWAIVGLGLAILLVRMDRRAEAAEETNDRLVS